MKIDIQFDTRNLRARTLREKKNLAYSTSQALNETAKDIQQTMRIRMDRVFNLRKTDFMYRMIKIFKFSSARTGTTYAEIGVQQRPRLLLALFERGGRRKPVKGRNVAVPITGSPARVSEKSTIPEEFTFRKMKLKRRKTKSGKIQYQGQTETFLLPNQGVFQRRNDRIQMLYKLITPSRIKRIPAVLHLNRIAQDLMRRKFNDSFRKFYNRYQ